MTLKTRFRNNPLSFTWFSILGFLLVLGAAAGITVFIMGLGITNLSDLVPWGLWITIDLSSIALSGGAFLFCAGVYLLGLEEFKPVARTAAYIGLIGYSMAMLCLVLDIGRPDRFYYGFIFWNTHSVLWEVTMCIGLYFMVLISENLSTLANWEWLANKFPRQAAWMRKTHDFAPYLAVAGLVLSMLHQSSLGAAYGVLIARPIWFRPGLAALFFVSAIVGGTALTFLALSIAGRIKPALDIGQDIVLKGTRFLGWALVVYLYLRFWDTFAMTYTPQPGRMEGLAITTGGLLSFNFWAGEILLGAIVPLVILLHRRWGAHYWLRTAALSLTAGGVIAYRWDTNLIGQLIVQQPFLPDHVPFYASYSPSLVEIAAGAGIIAYGLLAFTLGVQYFRVIRPAEA